MGVQPNKKTLLIPGKARNTQAQPEYGTDMRAIENAFNSGGAEGPQGPQGAQGSSGGGSGGGGGMGYVEMIAMPDDNLFPDAFAPLSPYLALTGNDGQSNWAIFSNSTGSSVQTDIASSWLVDVVGGGLSANVLPQFTIPTFTGGTGFVSVSLFFWAALPDWSNYALYSASAPGSGIASGGTYQFTAADMSSLGSGGTDLTLTAGSGNTGNGLVSAAGGKYFGGVSASILIPAGTTFPGGGGGGGAYASLTGAGETSTPGQLSQAGEFDIAVGGHTTEFTSTGIIPSNGSFLVNDSDGNGIEFTTTLATGNGIVISTDGAGVDINISGGASVTIKTAITLDAATINIATTSAEVLSFFGAGGHNQQSSSGITTVAQLVTVLKNYGLLS